MDFKKHLLVAWEQTLKYLVPLIILTLVMLVVGVASLGILAPVMAAGYTQSILLMLREGREPKVQDLFSHMGLFFPLLVFAIVAGLAVMIGFMMLVVPGILVIAALLYSCLYVLPLMTDKGMGLMDAIRESYAMAKRDPLADHAVVAILFVAISSVGGSVLLGTLFTQPLATVFLLSVYEEKMGTGQAK